MFFYVCLCDTYGRAGWRLHARRARGRGGARGGETHSFIPPPTGAPRTPPTLINVIGVRTTMNDLQKGKICIIEPLDRT